MRLKQTKRDNIFERFFSHQKSYRYFYFGEDYASEMDVEMFGYSKFVCDSHYDDKSVQWNYILDDNKIVGIIALSKEQNNLKVNFLEIKSSLRGRGIGSSVIEDLKNTKGYKAITLYPKNDEVADSFYKPLGFKESDKGELIYKLCG